MSDKSRLAIARREQAKREALLAPAPKPKVVKVTKTKAAKKTKGGLAKITTDSVSGGALPPEVPDAPQTLDA